MNLTLTTYLGDNCIVFENSTASIGDLIVTNQVYCQSRSTIFPGILTFVIFRPRDMQEYIFMFSIALEWTVNLICDNQISN
jgi:hypothetical protein